MLPLIVPVNQRNEIVDRGLGATSAHLTEEPVIRHQEQRTTRLSQVHVQLAYKKEINILFPFHNPQDVTCTSGLSLDPMAQFVLGVALVDPVAELVVLGVEGGVKLLAGGVALLSDKIANLTV